MPATISVEEFLANDFAFEVAADHVHGAAAIEAGGDPQFGGLARRLPRRQLIAGNLLHQEAVVRLVVVE